MTKRGEAVALADSRSLSRMPVYDIVKGRVVGRVHRLIVDADARKVVGLLLATRLGREPRCLPFRHVHAIGEHAVTVRGTEAIAPVSELPDMEEAMRAQRRIYSSPILTEGGLFIGDVDEFTINTQSGRLESLLVSGGLMKDLFRGQAALPSHLIVAIGEDATIVKDIAVSFLEQRQREQRQQTHPAGTESRPRPAAPRTAHADTPAASVPDSPTPKEASTPVSWTERLRQALGAHGRHKRATTVEEPVLDHVSAPTSIPETAEQPKLSEQPNILVLRDHGVGTESSGVGSSEVGNSEVGSSATRAPETDVPGAEASGNVTGDDRKQS